MLGLHTGFRLLTPFTVQEIIEVEFFCSGLTLFEFAFVRCRLAADL